MYSISPLSPVEESLSRWQQVCQWAKQNDRCQKYQKNDRIICKSGLIYFVQRGVVRLNSQPMSNQCDAIPSLLSLVGVSQPFEVGSEQHVFLQAIAHVKNTEVFWLRISELSTFPGFEVDVLEAFCHQHRRQIHLLNNLTQGRTVDQLLGYLHLLAEEFGEEDSLGLNLPFPLTHSQLAGAIGSTRVTVTRLLGELRKYGEIQMWGGNKFSVPLRKQSPSHLHLLK